MTYIDSHQHFWSLSNSFTAWPSPELEAIYRDFAPSDLAPLLAEMGVSGTIAVQAAPDVAETYYLLELARDNPFIKGVVGWIDFEAEDAVSTLAMLAREPKFCGIRPMLQSVEAPGWILDPRFAHIFRALSAHGQCFDALIRRDQLPDIAALARRYGDLKIVIDHAAKPNIAAKEWQPWADDIAKAAQAPNLYCKLSGLWTEAGGDIQDAAIQPYAAHILETFGPSRTLWGSDWPVINMAGSYHTWLRQCQRLTAHFSDQDRANIFAHNARQFYNVQ